MRNRGSVCPGCYLLDEYLSQDRRPVLLNFQDDRRITPDFFKAVEGPALGRKNMDHDRIVVQQDPT